MLRKAWQRLLGRCVHDPNRALKYITEPGEAVHLEKKKGDEQYLYVILPYFNYCRYESRKRLFLDFVKRIQHVSNVRVVIAEARETHASFELPSDTLKCFLHVRVVTDHPIWIKENLINVAVQQLPSAWKYMAWIDADITFLNSTWVEDTLKTLQSYDVAQMFQSCANLGPSGETLKLDQSFFYMQATSGKPYHPKAKYGFWHPGYAWACTRKAYDQMGGLVDFAILGSGDRHMALALIGLVECSHPGNIHPQYAQRLRDFQAKCTGLRASFVPGTILHHFHGSLADRKYQERWNILTKNQYNPDQDIVRAPNGVLQLTKPGLRLRKELAAYFVGRNEDNTDVVPRENEQKKPTG